jgi:hypothetical protein
MENMSPTNEVTRQLLLKIYYKSTITSYLIIKLLIFVFLRLQHSDFKRKNVYKRCNIYTIIYIYIKPPIVND